MGALLIERRPVDRLARYGFSEDELEALEETLHRFRCRDTCGRQRRCLIELAKAMESGDALAEKLMTTCHHDRLMDEAALAYGRKVGRIFC